MRYFLDTLYRFAGGLGALCLIAILFIIVAQMVCRWFGVSFPGSTAYAGYFMASASFLAFAYALNSGTHIRVSLLLNFLNKRNAKLWFIVEVWCFAIATVVAFYIAYFALLHAYGSWYWNDISQERDELPLWIVQVPMVIGSFLLAIAFFDNLISLILHRRHNISQEKVGGK